MTLERETDLFSVDWVDIHEKCCNTVMRHELVCQHNDERLSQMTLRQSLNVLLDQPKPCGALLNMHPNRDNKAWQNNRI